MSVSEENHACLGHYDVTYGTLLHFVSAQPSDIFLAKMGVLNYATIWIVM
jgi:hypothetical protein